MKELAIVYLALTLITIAGCTSTKNYNLDSSRDRATLTTAAGHVRVLLTTGETLYGTNFRFSTDSLSFAVSAEESWPPAADFRGYNTTMAISRVEGMGASTPDTGKTVGLWVASVATGGLLVLAAWGVAILVILGSVE